MLVDLLEDESACYQNKTLYPYTVCDRWRVAQESSDGDSQRVVERRPEFFRLSRASSLAKLERI